MLDLEHISLLCEPLKEVLEIPTQALKQLYVAQFRVYEVSIISVYEHRNLE